MRELGEVKMGEQVTTNSVFPHGITRKSRTAFTRKVGFGGGGRLGEF